MDLSCCFRCFAHTLNLGVSKAVKATAISTLLGHMRKVVSYFHHSSLAKAALINKQLQMKKPAHILIIDVQTRWNSTLAMMERFIEQQSVVYAVVCDMNKTSVSTSKYSFFTRFKLAFMHGCLSECLSVYVLSELG